MEYRRLGSLEVSLVGIGCNNFGWRTDAAGTAAVAFSWLASRPEVCSVIAGAKTPDQVRANSVAASWKLKPADLAGIDRVLS